MYQPETTLPFREIEEMLLNTNSEIGASETHGMLCGYICAGSNMNGKALIDQFLHGPAADIDTPLLIKRREMILALYNFSYEQINSMDFEFQLLLPDDDMSLPQRAHDLGEWCHGYIAGLAIAGVTINDCKSEEVRDALFRLSEIARIDYQVLEMNNADEMAFMEVSEYVRMVVLMLYTEIVMPNLVKHVAETEDAQTVH